MNSDQKPEKWGYGLTWLITAGLVVMVAVGVVKLRQTAIDSTIRLRAEKAEAMEIAKQQFEAETKATEALEAEDFERAAWRDFADGRIEKAVGLVAISRLDENRTVGEILNEDFVVARVVHETDT